MRRIAVLFGLLLSLSACTPPGPATALGRTQITDPRFESQVSGLEGRMWQGPMCPVVRVGETCPDQAFAGTVQVNTLEGVAVGQIQADAEGRFRLGLKPGNYVLSGLGARVYPSLGPQQVEVPQGTYAQIEVQFDSGIR